MGGHRRDPPKCCGFFDNHDKMVASDDSSGVHRDRIGGWLLLFAIGLVIYPVRAVFSLGTQILPAFASTTWTGLTRPDAPNYHPLWKPLLIFELAGNVLLALCVLWLLVWFFQRRKAAPRLAIIFLVLNLFYVGADTLWAWNLPGGGQPLAFATLRDVVRTAVACLIWIPYFIFSKRVKETFVR
jgi:hypothetical protein